ncbi:S8 family serine peptidase [Parahaliea mediterranea]|uniref:S8 family serine peptidase n=2 Tax=Parahaliea mediterranea TaxID=651086 RepID=A0A939DEE8_9GAMM|nr:S8 family serine peptidase [Parahaliea mediterranea]
MVPEEEIEEDIEDQVAEEVEDQTEDEVEDSVEDEIEDQVEEGAEETIEDNIEEDIEASIEDDVQDSVEEVVEASVEEDVEAGIEESVEETVELAVEDSVEDSVEESLEVAVEDSVETGVEESVEADVEESVEEGVEFAVESSVEASVEETVEVAVEDSVENQVETAVESSVEDSVEGSVEEDVEARVAEAVEGRLENKIDEILDEIESEFEVDEARIQTEQWLVMAEPEAFEELAERGYLFERVTELPGMGLRLAEVAAPSSFEISEVRKGVVDVVGSGRADVDLNHFYTAGSPITHSVEGIPPRNAVPFPADMDEMTLKIGMIDSQVDTAHPALAQSRISAESFVRAGNKVPDFHGTAIASIIAANAPDYRGLAPRAQLYAAGVFELDDERGEVASTVSLVRALDWLVTAGVDVVNVSLAGPPNRLLETALKRASEKGVLVLAAAGNGGPMAKPMYPAAYDTVVAVTAVDARGRIFRLANRGDYLDIAAPGVGMLHARAGGGYATSSGTSFAVPFATTAAARLRLLEPGVNVLDSLYRSAEDLGPPGRDEIYGYGLLRPLPVVTSGR